VTRKSITDVSLSYAKFICDRRSSTFIIGYVKLSRWFGRDEATITISIHHSTVYYCVISKFYVFVLCVRVYVLYELLFYR